VSELAEIAPDVDASLSDVTDAPPPVEVQEALSAVVATLRASAATYERTGDEPPHAPAERARLLAELAEHLEQPRAWQGVDRFVHQLMGDLLLDALRATDSGVSGGGALSARALALKAMARHEPLWPGAGGRAGCAYGYDSFLALVRQAGLAESV
jgi:hypothetical protein